jgi:outer membrane protein assembly factor BamB/tetratricopeptide (TPR) repeat protein
MLKGDLSSFSLGEIFQSLAINNHTGTLKISSKNNPDKLIYFDNGEITLFSTGSADLPRMGEVLIRLGKISQEGLDEALAEQSQTKAILGEVLLQRGFVSEDDLRAALETKIREEIYDLFLWNQGAFEFHMDYFPQELIDDLQKKTGIALKTHNVVMEGLRQLDEWTLLRKRIQTFDEILVRTAELAEDSDKALLSFFESIDGTRPVRDLIKLYPGSRFECVKTLFELLEADALRELTVAECKEMAEKRLKGHQLAQAAAYLQFATQLCPDEADTYRTLGDTLAGIYQDNAAIQAYLKGMRLCFKNGAMEATATLGEKLLQARQLEDDDLEKIFKAFLALKNVKKATSTGGQLASSYQQKGDVEKAAAVLESLTTLDPGDLNLRIQIATLFEKAGDPQRAIRHLEEVSVTLEKEKKYRDLVKVLRLVAELDPKRQEIRQKINVVHLLQERIEQRKKRRITIAGIFCTFLLVLAVVPCLYEIKAREFLSHAQRLEQISMLSMDFQKAKAAYEDLIKNYSLSLKVAEAQEALRRISSIERSMFDQIEKESTARKEEQDNKLLSMKQSLALQLREAESAEQAGDLKKAHEIYKRVAVEFTELPATKNILFPLRITSDPPGAQVFQDGKEIGKTPFVCRYKPGTVLNLLVTKSSCENVQQTVEANDQWELQFALKRRPFAEFAPAMAIHQPMVVSQGHIVFPSRDGYLYSIDPKAKSVAWQRAVGRFGDRVSNLEARNDEVFLGTVTGEVTALSALTGKSRWVTKVGSSVLAAPAVSRDGKWVVVGTTGGLVHVISNENGAIITKFATENEILAKPIFAGDMLIAGSTDNHIYGYSITKMALVFVEDLSADVLVDPASDEKSVLIATADAKVHCFDLSSLKVVWSQAVKQPITAPVVVSPSGVHLGTSGGQLITLNKKTGQPSWEISTGTGPVSGMGLYGAKLYLSTETGKVAAIDLNQQKVVWDYQSDTPFLSPPLVFGGVLYQAGASGKIQLLEVLE